MVGGLTMFGNCANMTGFMKTVSKLCAESQLKRKKLGKLKEEQ